MFEQAKLRGIPMFPHGLPNAKEPAEIAILENQVIWVILVILAKTGHRFWRTISEPGLISQGGNELGVWLRSTRQSHTSSFGPA